MRIASSTLRSAMFSVLGLGVRDSTQICMQDLQQDWPQTGLRQSDFPLALNELTTQRYATLAVRGAETVVRLTERGVEEFLRPSTPWPRRVMDWLVLHRLRLRRRHLSLGKPPARRRRLGDAPIVPHLDGRRTNQRNSTPKC